MSGYLPVAIYLGFIVAFAVVSLGVAAVLRPSRPYAAKLENYECGAEPIGEAWVQFPVGFYLVALIFIVFDALAVFLFPWALVAPVTRAVGGGNDGACSSPSSRSAGSTPTRRGSSSGNKVADAADSAARLDRVQGPLEWEKLHQERPEGDKHSVLFESVTEGIYTSPAASR